MLRYKHRWLTKTITKHNQFFGLFEWLDPFHPMVQGFDEWFGGSWLCLRWLCLVKSMKGKDSKLLDVNILISANKKVKCQPKKFQKLSMNWGKSGFPLFLDCNPFHVDWFMFRGSFFCAKFHQNSKKMKKMEDFVVIFPFKKTIAKFWIFCIFFYHIWTVILVW